MGQVNNLINFPSAITALEQIIDWEPKRIKDCLKPLILEIGKKAESLGWVPPQTNLEPLIFGITPTVTLPANLNFNLKKEKVYVSQRGDGLRLSPHSFNDQADIEFFFHTLKKILQKS